MQHAHTHANREQAQKALSAYAEKEIVGNLYDADRIFASALVTLAGPAFEYPDFSHLTVVEAKKKAERLYAATKSNPESSVAATLKPFTVLGFNGSTGQIFAHHIDAIDGCHAFAIIASKYQNAEFVAAVEGHLAEATGLTFPGESVVDAETVIEQPEVFGSADRSSSNDSSIARRYRYDSLNDDDLAHLCQFALSSGELWRPIVQVVLQDGGYYWFDEKDNAPDKQGPFASRRDALIAAIETEGVDDPAAFGLALEDTRKSTQSSTPVMHWNAYGDGGTKSGYRLTHQMDLDDQRLSNGQLYVDIAPLEGVLDDDMMCMVAEVATNPLNGLDHVPCLHVAFDGDNQALSLFKIGDRILMRPESEVIMDSFVMKDVDGTNQTWYWLK